MNSLVAELVDAAAKERFSLEQCRDLLSSFAALQVMLVLSISPLFSLGIRLRNQYDHLVLDI